MLMVISGRGETGPAGSLEGLQGPVRVPRALCALGRVGVSLADSESSAPFPFLVGCRQFQSARETKPCSQCSLICSAPRASLGPWAGGTSCLHPH